MDFSKNIPVLHQDDQFLVVDKPEGLSVHNAEDSTNLIEVLEKGFAGIKLFPIHRLDKETSGVQLFAKNSGAAAELAESFRRREVKKTYLGVLRGILKLKFGVWQQPITDKSEGRKNPAGVTKNRIPAETRFRVLESSKYFTLCEFDLITGRQHQIRKHASMAGHSLIGDPRYGDKKFNERMAGIYGTDRMFLHCLSIDIQGNTFTSPTPDVFAKLLK